MASAGTPGPDEPRFDGKTVALMGLGHFTHDSYPAFLGVMLPLLIPKLGITLAAAGILTSSIRWTTSVQPVLGYWADRTDARWWVVIPPTTTAVLMTMVGLAPAYAVALALLLMAGLSHASFHPAAGAMATRAAGRRWGKAASYFMTGGEMGRAVGPLAAAAILAWRGLDWIWIAIFPGLAMSVLLYRRLRRLPAVTVRHPPGDLLAALRARGRSTLWLSAVMVLRNLANVGLVIFLPTLATRQGAGILVAGLAVTLYELGGTAGAFVGGTVSDSLGRRRVLAAGVALGVPILAASLLLGPNPLGLALLAMGGFLFLSGHPVQLVLMQEFFPDNRSTSVGLSYLMNSVGAIVATIGVGALGDVLGLRSALLLGLGAGSLAIPFILALPRRVKTSPA